MNDPLLATPQVHAFAQITECPKCGLKDKSEEKVNAVALSTRTQALFAALDRVLGRLGPALAMRRQYCKGGQGPESEQKNPLAVVFEGAATLSASPGPEFMEKLQELNGRKINICAGIGAEHLHLFCQLCGYEFLMECKDSEVRKEI